MSGSLHPDECRGESSKGAPPCRRDAYSALKGGNP